MTENYIGKYKVINKLGSGSFGEVFLVHGGGKNVALKILKSGFNDPITIKRFKREAQSIAQLNHRGIARVYEIGEHQGRLFYTMDYIEGQTLDLYLKQQKHFEPKYAAMIIKRIAKVVNHAHKNNIIHRDIKPENIILGKDGEVYVTDFGLAKSLDTNSQVSQTGNIIGSPAYMSPEQVEGKKRNIDFRTDIYSIGVTLYEMITGRLPFIEDSVPSMLHSVMYKHPRTPRSIREDIPAPLEEICLRCLEKNKEHRYQNLTTFLKNINDFIEGKNVRRKKHPQLPIHIIAVVSGVVCTILGVIVYSMISADTSSSRKEVETPPKESRTPTTKKIPLQGKTLQKKMWQDYHTTGISKALKITILKAIIYQFPNDSKARSIMEKSINSFLRNHLVDGRYFNGEYYGAFRLRLNWVKANDKCQQLGGHLVTIYNREKANFISKYTESTQYKHRLCWIGLCKESGRWLWVTKKPLGYTSWRRGEPNNVRGQEYYVVLQDGKWVDVDVRFKAGFICQWPMK